MWAGGQAGSERAVKHACVHPLSAATDSVAATQPRPDQLPSCRHLIKPMCNSLNDPPIVPRALQLHGEVTVHSRAAAAGSLRSWAAKLAAGAHSLDLALLAVSGGGVPHVANTQLLTTAALQAAQQACPRLAALVLCLPDLLTPSLGRWERVYPAVVGTPACLDAYHNRAPRATGLLLPFNNPNHYLALQGAAAAARLDPPVPGAGAVGGGRGGGALQRAVAGGRHRAAGAGPGTAGPGGAAGAV